MYRFPKKYLFELRDARVKRLVDEQKQLEHQQNELQRQQIHNEILRK